METLREYLLPCRSVNDTVRARVRIVPEQSAQSHATAPLVELDAASATEHGETTVQLREQSAYEYEVISEDGNADLRLRCDRATRSPSITNRLGDRGRIFTGNFSGTLLLEIVEGEALPSKSPVASAFLDIRSVKLDYRTEYRGMLRAVANELTGLVADARSSAKLGFRSSWQERRDAGWLQIQIELLREMLDSAEFGASVQRILTFPHERLASEPETLPANFPFRWTPSVTRQVASGQPRCPVPTSHVLRQTYGLATLPERMRVQRKTRDRDTPENRFIKHALLDFHSFLAHCQTVFEENKGWETASALARRLSATVEDWLGRALFREVGPMRFAPLGSPVLQRKAGYREVLSGWLRFRMAARNSSGRGNAMWRTCMSIGCSSSCSVGSARRRDKCVRTWSNLSKVWKKVRHACDCGSEPILGRFLGDSATRSDRCRRGSTTTGNLQ